MTLTLIQRNPDASGAPRRADFRAPGGTLGRDPANHLVLPDDTGTLCRVQAALRVDPYACRLRNLSSMSQVSINDVPLAAGQELSIAPGDTLRIGAYVLGVELSQAAPPAAQTGTAYAPEPVAATAAPSAVTATARAPEPMPAEPQYAPDPAPQEAARVSVSAPPVATHAAAAPRQPEPPAVAPAPMAPPDFPDLSDFDAVGKSPAGGPDPLLAAAPAAAAPAPAPQQPPEDVFSGLFGPGTLPVGTVSDVSAHPFELDSAQARNAADPLSHLPRGDASVSRPQRDPLAMFDAPHGGHDVFADQTPSTLPAHDPLQPMRSDPVRDTLQRPREDDRVSTRDNAPMSGSFLRPAAPREPARPGADRNGNDRGNDR